jgi:transcriptional regulator with GAF, ATPase, and Fis domain
VLHSPNSGTPLIESGRADNSERQKPQNYPPQAVILVCDPNAARRNSIATLVQSCGATLKEIPNSDLDRVERSSRQNVALVALGSSSAPESNSFAAIRLLKLKGFNVVSYEDQLFSQQIGKRCRALLCGSALLLDSSSPSFSADLQSSLIKSWEEETERFLEETRIKEQMTNFGIIGMSSTMMAVFRWVVRVSSLSDFPVLINGETGTGKELIARALYRLDGKRSKGPFIAANCSAISAGLAESELFGHRKGAFTGADSDRKGLFRSAEGGVLFLDEIGDLDQSLQAKLLRVLQEERVLAVGFDREVPVDVRVIAATNRDLEAMVKEGSFREDLYHRLSGLSIMIPPLRERKEDLLPLTEHFLRRYSALSPSGTRTVSADFLDALGRVKLSGNVRQLENIVRRALLSVPGNSPLSLGDLTPTEWEQLSEERTVFEEDSISSNHKGNGNGDEPLDVESDFLKILDLHDFNLSKSLEYCERLMLKCALEFNQGNQSRTARLIGITPRSVYNKVHKHKLNH